MVKFPIDSERKDINQLFVVAFLSCLDGASVASTCHQSVWLERFFQKSLKNWQKSPTIPHSSNLWGIFPKFAFYCIFINKYQNPHNRENSPFLVTLNARNFCWAAEGLSDWLVWLVDNKNIVGCCRRRSPPEIYREYYYAGFVNKDATPKKARIWPASS